MHHAILETYIWYQLLVSEEEITAMFGGKELTGPVVDIRPRHESLEFTPEIHIDTDGATVCVGPADLVLDGS